MIDRFAKRSAALAVEKFTGLSVAAIFAWLAVFEMLCAIGTIECVKIIVHHVQIGD